MNINRRKFLAFTLAGIGTLMLPRFSFAALPRLLREEPDQDPHFFLSIYIQGGADQSYLYDARPLAMTAAGKIQNYLGEDPILYTGSNGQSCWATSITKILEPYQNRFSVLNGVTMATSFDGHDQNLNFLLAGNPFGGESFIPHLNIYTGKQSLPLDGVTNQASFFSAVTNEGNVVSLAPSSIGPFTQKLGQLPDLDHGELGAFVRSRLNENSNGSGRFSAGVQSMLNGFEKMPELKAKLKGLENPVGETNEQKFASLVSGVFKNGVARTATLTLENFMDTHAYSQAKEQPKEFKSIAEKIAMLYRTFSDTPYDDKRSMLDVTTVMVHTEFGRTMRSPGEPIDHTGTNHNGLTNTILLGGKGIRGGQVIGASDFRTSDEVLSPAHMKMDERMEKCMGQPFDFSRMAPSNEKPEAFDIAKYLSAHSVVNTIYSAFNVPTSRYRTLDRAGTLAPVLTTLLS